MITTTTTTIPMMRPATMPAIWLPSGNEGGRKTTINNQLTGAILKATNSLSSQTVFWVNGTGRCQAMPCSTHHQQLGISTKADKRRYCVIVCLLQKANDPKNYPPPTHMHTHVYTKKTDSQDFDEHNIYHNARCSTLQCELLNTIMWAAQYHKASCSTLCQLLNATMSAAQYHHISCSSHTAANIVFRSQTQLPNSTLLWNLCQIFWPHSPSAPL